MTRRELEKMISLAGDEYIDEIYSLKLRSRKSFSALKALSAAAAIAAVFSAGAIALVFGKSENTPFVPPVTSELQTEITRFTVNTKAPDGTAVPEEKRSMPADYDESFDYSVYFPAAEITGIYEYDFSAGGDVFNFSPEYAAELMPFDTKTLPDGNSAYVYCDKEKKPVTALIFLENRAMERLYGVDLIISDNGNVYPEYALPDDLAPVRRNGVDIYGYDKGDAGGGFRNVCAFFENGGIGYTVNVYGMTCAQAVGIIDSLIESGTKAADFDITLKTDREKVTPELINKLRNEKIFDSLPYLQETGPLVLDEENSVCVTERSAAGGYTLFLTFTAPDTSESVSLVYRKNEDDNYGTDGTYPIFEMYKFSRGDLKYAQSTETGDRYYFFIKTPAGVLIEVTADCAAEKLWDLISSMQEAFPADGVLYYEIFMKAGNATETLGGVAFTENTPDKTVKVSFALPSEWYYDDGAAYYQGEEMMITGHPWYAEEGYVTDDIKELVNVTLYEEKYGTDGLYEYMRHTSAKYYGGGSSETYDYVVKRGDYCICLYFSVNGYFDSSYIEPVLKSLEITE